VVNKKAKHHRALGTGAWKKLRLVVLARDGYTCYACGGEAKEVDHIWPRAKGGDTFDPLNCAAICTYVCLPAAFNPKYVCLY
jgi:5-methylcytosine-specific restriction endonuclease McrA